MSVVYLLLFDHQIRFGTAYKVGPMTTARNGVSMSGGGNFMVESDESALDNELDNDLENDTDTDEASDELAASEMDGEELLDPSMENMDKMNDKGMSLHSTDEEAEDVNLDEIDNLLDLSEEQFPRFTLAKNKARFLRMVSWYRSKEEWIEVAPLSGVTKLFKQQTKELEGIRASKLDYEMELETGTLTPSQRSYRRDELKMCKVQEKMAVHLISKLQLKIKSGRR
ncbi:MAG: hypothetical protein V4736_07190 [Bdellovibrionota bacterium]